MATSPSKKLLKKQQDEETARRRAFIAETLFPWLSKNTKSIDDARNTCKAAVMIMQERFTALVQEVSNAEGKRLSNVKLSELDVKSSFKSKDEKKLYKDFEGLFTLLEGESVSTAEAFLVGLNRAIEGKQMEEMRARKLDTIDIKSLFS